MTNDDHLLHPRPIDRPTTLPLDGPIDRDAADAAKIFAAPDDPADWRRWRERLVEWRHAARERWPYDDDAYTRPAAQWARRCFSVALVWLWDERLFDHATHRFDVGRFLDTTADFGGFDAVVLWQAYPIIGIDERSQFDFYRDVPGIAGVVRGFQERGLKVFVDYNPWDTATSAVADHPKLVAELVGDLGVDGVFLDTMSEGGATLRASLATLPEPPVLEGESKVSLERIADHQLSWAQWFADSSAPGVIRARWFERRHMLHHTRRWNRDHSDELQSSWTNGVGMLVWDAVFGSWVGWNERDRGTLRAMVRAQRALADVLTRGHWTPLTDATPEAIDAGVHASRFELGPIRLWTVVNRGDADYTGPVLDAPARSASAWFEVTGGTVLADSRAPITVPARSVAGILAVDGDVPADVQTMLDAAAADRRSPDATFPLRLPKAAVRARSISSTPDPTAVVVASGQYEVTVTSRLRETGMYDGAPFVDAWKPLPPLLHSEVTETRTVDIGHVAVGASEVSNDDFAAFVDATGYRPDVANRFAAHWRDGCPVPGTGDAPMTFVDLADAHAYARWSEARLPTEFEWQLAGTDPGFQRREPLVWNLTAGVYSDGITRFVMVKGGSAYEPGRARDEVEGVDPSLSAKSIDWYFDGGPRDSSFSAKLLVAGLGLTRSSHVGFRLAWDLDRVEEVDDG